MTERLRAMPRGLEGQRARFVLAMAAYGASELEIAAALDLTTSALTEIDRYHVQLGRGAAQGRLLDLLWKKAEGGNAGAMMWLYGRMAKVGRSEQREAAQRARACNVVEACVVNP